MSQRSICEKCVLDSNTPDVNIYFDENGICNNCRNYDEFNKTSILSLSLETRKKKLEIKVSKIKERGANSKYDCVLGLSGGMDSAYLALRAYELGLRPLVVHFDNGWNSELAIKNIENTISNLGFDLITYVINWEEFKDLQLSYLKASVIDIEVPTDQFIYASLFEVAYKNDIKFILDGNNIETEFWGGSWKWSFDKLDLVNLKNIHKKYGEIKLRKFPKIGKYQRYFYSNIVGIESVYLLNYLPFDKKNIEIQLEKKLDWNNPGGKHYESVFTRFYQGVILPEKFGVDKRKSILSNLIWSNQLTRNEALDILKNPTYDLSQQKSDLEYVLKKLEISLDEYHKIMNKKSVNHEFYGTDLNNFKTFLLFTKISKTIFGRTIYFFLRRLRIIKNLH